MADHLFPRLEWAKLRLSFKKLELFIEEVPALGILHRAGGNVLSKHDRTAKIHDWPVPRTPQKSGLS
jgi:hypothetical protein